MGAKIVNILFLLICTFLISSSCSENPSVIIIGAGASGIAAATRLLKHGVNNIKILEAESRIGGRINSVKFGDAFFDLGAEIIHGEKGNIVFDLVKDYHILEPFNLTHKIIYSDGYVIDKEFSDELFEFGEKYLVQRSVNISAKSMGEAFLKVYNSTLIEKYKNDKKKLKILLAAKDFFEKFGLSWETALDWFDVAYAGGSSEFQGEYALSWNGHGFKTVLDVLMEKYPNSSKDSPFDDKIHLSKEVTMIIWGETSTNQVIVRCVDGTSYTSDHVIFTPSLGVLKAQHETLFEPNLPLEKQSAIAVVGFGVIMKIVLHFPNKWWKVDSDSYGLIWSIEDKETLAKQFPEGAVRDGISWLNYLNYIGVAENNPNVLVIWLSGKMVPDIEKLSDQVILDGTTFALKKFFGKIFNVTEPDSMIHSSWYSNPHFRGSYTYGTVKEQELGGNLRRDLAAPLFHSNLTPKVLFAGEATHPEEFGTVHGALATGFREADRILRLYKIK